MYILKLNPREVCSTHYPCACVYMYIYVYAPTSLILSPTIEQLLGTAHQTSTTDVLEISHTRSVAAGSSADIMTGTGQ